MRGKYRITLAFVLCTSHDTNLQFSPCNDGLPNTFPACNTCAILPSCSDGKLEIVVPSFVHYLEVLEGSDGEKLPGFQPPSSTLYSLVYGSFETTLVGKVFKLGLGEEPFRATSTVVIEGSEIVPGLRQRLFWIICCSVNTLLQTAIRFRV